MKSGSSQYGWQDFSFIMEMRMKKFRDSQKNLIHQNAGGGENSIVRMH